MAFASAARKKIVISFDYDHDRNYRYLLAALKENASSAIAFEDLTSGEIDSSNVGRIKAALARKITEADYTLVIIGKYANAQHPQYREIGNRNWQHWEIERAKVAGHRFIAVKISSENSSPDPLLNVGTTWARAFKVDSILRAIDEA